MVERSPLSQYTNQDHSMQVSCNYRTQMTHVNFITIQPVGLLKYEKGFVLGEQTYLRNSELEEILFYLFFPRVIDLERTESIKWLFPSTTNRVNRSKSFSQSKAFPL